MEGPQQPSSLACIQADEIFPKKPLISDDPSLQVLFPELEGEAVEYLGSTTDATLAVSNYRLFISFKDSFLNIPIHLIESVELKDLFYLQINCKDARSFRIAFDNNEQCMKWLNRLSNAVTSSGRIDDLFAFPFYCWTMEFKTNGYCITNGDSNGLCHTDGMSHYSFLDEVRRLGFDTNQDESPWRITDVNSNFELCPTYPKLHVIPKAISDSDLEDVAAFRCAKRFPSIVWRHPGNGAIIARCSQPEVGWLGWRSSEDEKLLQAIGTACAKSIPSQDGNVHENGIDNDHIPNGHVPTEESSSLEEGKVLILDARSYTAAVANRAKGGGCECTEYYPNCEVEFMNLANIHAIRKSFHSLRNLCSGTQDVFNWWSQMEKTNWLHCLSMLMKAAITVVHAVDKEGKPVVVHCSDGWDRTTQIVALAELLLDPYYRTIEGFKVLVDREWLEFGHRFADRCGHGMDFDENQRCPVFLQWLDCVHQLQRHFPCAFEFNETFLCKLVQHTYSCLFGTFFCNSELERQKHNVKMQTFSVWSLFHPRRKEFQNFLYNPHSNQVLIPSYHVRNLELWSAVYLAYPIPFTHNRDLELPEDTPSTASSSSSSLRFPINFSDSNLELKSCFTTHLNSSKSDGDLLRHSSGKKGNDAPLDHVTKESNSDSLPSSNGLSTACNGVVNHSVKGNTCTEQNNSLYYSTSEEKRDSVSPEGTTPQDMVCSMTSSAATIIQEEPQSDSEVADTEDTVSGTISFGRTLKEFSTNSRCRQDSSSYEHLAASLNELNNTGDNDGSLDSCTNLEKTTGNKERCTPTGDNSTDNLTKEISIQTIENPKPITSQGTQTNDSITTLKLAVSNMYLRYLDNDGLTVIHNAVQDRLRQIEMQYQERMETLHAQVLEERRRRLAGTADVGVACRGADLNDEVRSLPDSTQSGDQPPSHGSGDDESSWIEIEECDAEPTRWVPDHAVTSCANCDTEFWIVNRKHHCRNCGLVFCSTCSNHNLPVPDEQLYDPVRVCLSCFEKLLIMKELAVQRTSPDMVSAVG